MLGHHKNKTACEKDLIFVVMRETKRNRKQALSVCGKSESSSLGHLSLSGFFGHQLSFTRAALSPVEWLCHCLDPYTGVAALLTAPA